MCLEVTTGILGDIAIFAENGPLRAIRTFIGACHARLFLSFCCLFFGLCHALATSTSHACLLSVHVTRADTVVMYAVPCVGRLPGTLVMASKAVLPWTSIIRVRAIDLAFMHCRDTMVNVVVHVEGTWVFCENHCTCLSWTYF